ncbi:sulfotransferase [bacterium]|nr:sulfotransferase [bacterium]
MELEPMTKKMLVIDVSGFSFSGKSAVFDLLTTQQGVKSFDREFEFDFIRVPSGLLDLKNAICGEDWSPVRSSEAIRKFSRLVKQMGGSRNIADRLFKPGNHYDIYFPGFTNFCQIFINEIIAASWQGPWPFDFYSKNSFEIFYKKLMTKVNKSSFSTIYLARMSHKDFLQLSSALLNKIFSSCTGAHENILLLSNAFESFNPICSMELASDCKSIVVDRDPRDIYLSALYHATAHGSKVGASVIGNNVEDFVQRYKIYRMAINTNEDPSKVLRINFEDLVFDTSSTITQIENFLDVETFEIGLSGSRFSPDSSSKNTELWKREMPLYLSKRVDTIEKLLL